MKKTRSWTKAWHIAILWSLVVPSQSLLELGGLLGTPAAGKSGSGGGGLLGSGGLLGTGVGGEKGLLGTGLLGSGGVASDSAKGNASEKGSLLGTGLLGGGGSGGGGLLGIVGGGGGGDGGLLRVGGLLGNATGGLLGGGDESGGGGLLGGVLGEKGLLGDTGLPGGGLLGKDGLLNLGGDKGLLGGLLGGNLLGLEGLLGSGQSKEPFKWFNLLNLEIVGGSWKVLRGTELVLNLQARVSVNFPGLLRFLSGAAVEMNITPHLAVTQPKPGDLQLVLKNCKDLVAGFTVKLPSGLLATLMNGFINTGLRTILPSLMCPVFQIWFNLINLQLHALNDYVFFGLLGKIQTALSSVPVSTGQFAELDLKDKPFPGAFLEWLLKFVGSIGSPKSS